MASSEFSNIDLKLIEKIKHELKNIELNCSDILVREKLHNLVDLIEKETIDNRAVLEEMIRAKIKETRGTNSELNTSFYLLYRNFKEGRITMKEAQTLYDMYVKEINTL